MAGIWAVNWLSRSRLARNSYRRVAGREEMGTGGTIDTNTGHGDPGGAVGQWPRPGRVDDAYLRRPRLSRFWRSVLFQMILFGAYVFAVALLPSLSD